MVFTFKKPSLSPLHVAVSNVAVSQMAVSLAASLNITNYNPIVAQACGACVRTQAPPPPQPET